MNKKKKNNTTFSLYYSTLLIYVVSFTCSKKVQVCIFPSIPCANLHACLRRKYFFSCVCLCFLFSHLDIIFFPRHITNIQERFFQSFYSLEQRPRFRFLHYASLQTPSLSFPAYLFSTCIYLSNFSSHRLPSLSACLILPVDFYPSV